MTDFHGIQIAEDNSRGSVRSNGGAASPPSGYLFLTLSGLASKPAFLTTTAPDGSRVRVITKRA